MDKKQTAMTPKEKAEELVDKMYFSRRYDDTESYIPQRAYNHAKQCALIAVDEIIKSNPIIPLQFMLESEAIDAAVEYWQQVKQEIEKL